MTQAKVTKLTDIIDEYCDHCEYLQRTKDQLDDNEVKVRLRMVNDLIPEIKNLYRETKHNIKSEDQNRFEYTYKKFSETYIKLLVTWEDKIQSLTAKPTLDQIKAEERVKLPIITLPDFDGSYDKWIEFRDTFESLIHKSVKLRNIEKFHYLKTSIKLPSGQPNILNNFILSEANYENAWKAVKSRYNDTQQLKSDYFDSLFTLKKMTAETAPELRKVIDHFSTVYTSLDQLEADYDDLRIHLALRKIDYEVHKDWNHHIEGKKATWKIFIDFLNVQWSSLNKLPQQSSSKKTSQKSNDGKSSSSSKTLTVTTPSKILHVLFATINIKFICARNSSTKLLNSVTISLKLFKVVRTVSFPVTIKRIAKANSAAKNVRRIIIPCYIWIVLLF